MKFYRFPQDAPQHGDTATIQCA